MYIYILVYIYCIFINIFNRVISEYHNEHLIKLVLSIATIVLGLLPIILLIIMIIMTIILLKHHTKTFSAAILILLGFIQLNEMSDEAYYFPGLKIIT